MKIAETIRILSLICLLSVVFWAQSTSPTQAQVAGQTTASASGETRKTSGSREVPIGPGDLLEISIFGTQDFHQEVRVSNAGDIFLPLIGSSRVANLSPQQASELVTRKLVSGNFYKDPQVSLLVKEYESEDIYVLGEVQHPGLYSILKARNLLQAISLAGGVTQKAGRTATITNSSRPEHQLTVSLSGNTQSNPEILPGDTIAISKAGVVYVVGDVRQPTGIVLESENLTVLQSIALAQGTNPDAALDHAKLIRRGSDGPQETSLPLKKMLSAKRPDVKVQAEDIIFVPKSSTSAFSKRGLEAVLQAATGVAMYTRY